MPLPGAIEAFSLWLLKKVTGKIFFPKDQKEILNKENQKILFNKNIFIINQNGRHGLADANNPPKELIELLKQTLTDSPRESKIQTQIVNSSFHTELYSLTDFFKEGNLPLEKVRPYLSEEFESILALSEYVRKSLTIANHNLAQRTKGDMDTEYGTRGRKLCNLYLRGYINKVIEEYAYPWIESRDLSENEKSKKINGLIEEVLRNSDAIFFIYYRKDEKIILNNISEKIKRKIEFIAIHAGGKNNISYLNKILKLLEKEENYKFYEVKQNDYYDSKAKCKLLDVYLRLIK